MIHVVIAGGSRMDELYTELYIEDDEKRELKKDCRKQRVARGILIFDISPKQANEYQL
jgi:hypothetical protein